MINSEIQELLDKGVTVQCDREPNDFGSTVFTREKKDGSSRTILNLKHLNEFVNYRHFEMQSHRCTESNKKGCEDGTY